jgi:RNA polymerase sigma-70 factor (ECF subfamily)
VLVRLDPSPIVALNRAVAVAMRDGAESGLALVESVMAAGELDDYYLAHSARAELCRRLARFDEAQASYARALALVKQAPERRFLERRVDACRQAGREGTKSRGSKSAAGGSRP